MLFLKLPDSGSRGTDNKKWVTYRRMGKAGNGVVKEREEKVREMGPEVDTLQEHIWE